MKKEKFEVWANLDRVLEQLGTTADERMCECYWDGCEFHSKHRTGQKICGLGMRKRRDVSEMAERGMGSNWRVDEMSRSEG